jgi:hypothetical protein
MTFEHFYSEVRPYLLDSVTESAFREIYDTFVRMTKQHVARVNAIASFVGDGRYFPNHDADKFDSPFYCFVQWTHLGNKIDTIVKDPEKVNQLIGDATYKHIVTRSHHPEFWDRSLNVNDAGFDRAAPKTNIDARSMSGDSLIEYVCDCMAMSVQLQKDPRAVFKWFDDNIGTTEGKRWIMTNNQLRFIYATADAVLRKLYDNTRVVHFDVDGVLRDIIGYFGTPDNDWDVKVNGKSIYDNIVEDCSCLEKMQPTAYLPIVKKFTRSPSIISTQIEPEAREATTKWLLRYFDNPQIIYVGEGSSKEKDNLVSGNSRIFDDHPRFPESSRLITVGYPYNNTKRGFRVSTPEEMEAVLEVLQYWWFMSK